MIADRRETSVNTASNGYETAAAEFMRWREQSNIGAAVVRTWGQSLPRGGVILDLGCGAGVPISAALINEGFVVYGIDASPTMAATFRQRFPDAHLACEPIERSRFFDRTFDGVIAVGLMFLLPPEVQRATIHRVSRVLNVGGRFLFTSPARKCTWTDALTGRQSLSLGAEEYRTVLLAAGLTLIDEHEDEGGNHYYDTRLMPPVLSAAV